jgi:hypothetical protein
MSELHQDLSGSVNGLRVELRIHARLVGFGQREPVDRVDMAQQNGVRIFLGHYFDLHAALCGQHEQMLLGATVEGVAGVVLLGNVGGLLYPHHVHDVALDVHAQNVGCMFKRLGRVGGKFDATCFTTTTNLHLGLHHHRIADAVRNIDGLLRGRDCCAGRDGDVVLREVLLPLIFE